MAYTTSKAVNGLGTVLAIGGTPTTVGEVLDITQSGQQWKTDPSTNMQSSAEEFITTIKSSGEYDITYNRVAADAGQIAVDAAFASGALTAFTITEPKGFYTTTGTKFAFSGVVTDLNYGPWSIDKNIIVKMKVKVSGSITVTAGT